MTTYGFLARNSGRILHTEASVVGRGKGFSNNVGEYSGLVAALEWLDREKLNGERITILSDSQLVVNQMNGLWNVNRGYYVSRWMEADRLSKKFGRLKFKWIPRERNAEADALSRQAYEDYCTKNGLPILYRKH